MHGAGRARRRTAVLGAAVLTMAVAACGGGGPSLDSWAALADPVCDELSDTLADVDPDDASDEVDSAIDDLEALEAPGGADGEIVDDAIRALREGLDDGAVLLVRLDVGDDALEAAAEFVEGPDVEDELDAVGASGADDCVDALERGVGDREAVEASLEVLDDLADLRVDDCVVLDPDLAEADCDDADGEILLTSFGEPDCPDAADITQTVERSDDDVEAEVGLCIASFEDPEDPTATDNFLEVGACADVETEDDGDFTVLEVPCDDAAATHEIVEGVDDGADCLDGEIAFATSEEEEEEFGIPTWCAAEL